MLFIFFNLCFKDNFYMSLFIGILCYLVLLIFIKNIIFYYHTTEHLYWLLLIFIMIDFTFFINHNRHFIEGKINAFMAKKNTNNISLNNSLNNPDLHKILIEDDDYTRIIV